MQKYFQNTLKLTTWEHFSFFTSFSSRWIANFYCHCFIAHWCPEGHLVCSGANAIRKCSPKRDDHSLFLWYGEGNWNNCFLLLFKNQIFSSMVLEVQFKTSASCKDSAWELKYLLLNTQFIHWHYLAKEDWKEVNLLQHSLDC